MRHHVMPMESRLRLDQSCQKAVLNPCVLAHAVSRGMSLSERELILSDDYKMKPDGLLKEDVGIMMNLADGHYDQGVEDCTIRLLSDIIARLVRDNVMTMEEATSFVSPPPEYASVIEEEARRKIPQKRPSVMPRPCIPCIF